MGTVEPSVKISYSQLRAILDTSLKPLMFSVCTERCSNIGKQTCMEGRCLDSEKACAESRKRKHRGELESLHEFIRVGIL